MANKLIKVGSRQIDVTGLSDAQVQKVIGASKNGGSLASRALATQLQKQQGGKVPNIGTPKVGAPKVGTPKTGGPNIPTTGSNINVDGKKDHKYPLTPEEYAKLSFNEKQAYDSYGVGMPTNATWNPNVVRTGNVQLPGTVSHLIEGNTQYTGVAQKLGNTATGVSKTTGQIDPTKQSQSAYNLERDDSRLNFNMNNPGLQVDAYGNRQDIITDPKTGEVRLVQTAGAPLSGTMNAFSNAIGNYTSNFQDAVSNAQNANYNFLTRNLATDKARDLEAAKQELANRGIPLDASKESLWGKTVESIDRKYQDLTNQANNQAIMAGNETLGAQVGAQNSILGSLTNTAQAFKQNATPYQGGNIDLSGTFADSTKVASGADLAKYQTDKDYAAKMAQINAQKAAAGGGGGGAPKSNVVFNG